MKKLLAFIIACFMVLTCSATSYADTATRQANQLIKEWPNMDLTETKMAKMIAKYPGQSKEIKNFYGEIVEWGGFVREIVKEDYNHFKITIKHEELPQCIVYVTGRDIDDIDSIQNLEKGQYITIKGKIKNIDSNNNIIISPAVLMGVMFVEKMTLIEFSYDKDDTEFSFCTFKTKNGNEITMSFCFDENDKPKSKSFDLIKGAKLGSEMKVIFTRYKFYHEGGEDVMVEYFFEDAYI